MSLTPKAYNPALFTNKMWQVYTIQKKTDENTQPSKKNILHPDITMKACQQDQKCESQGDGKGELRTLNAILRNC